MDKPNTMWMGEDGEVMDPESLSIYLCMKLQQDSLDYSAGVHTTNTLGGIDLFDSVGGGALFTEGIGALDMGASTAGPPEQSHLTCITPQVPLQQYHTDSFPGNIDFDSVGSHLLDYVSAPFLPPYYLDGVDPLPMPTTFFDPLAQETFLFRQVFQEQNQHMNIADIGYSFRLNEEFDTPISLAVQASNSSAVSGSRSSLENEHPTPTSSGSPGEEINSQKSSPVAPRRARRSKPMQEFPCSSCDRTFEKRYKLRKHEELHDRPYQCLVCGVHKGAKKAIQRHLWTSHKDYARRENITCEDRTCPFEGCKMVSRGDNLARHIRLKHRRDLGQGGPGLCWSDNELSICVV